MRQLVVRLTLATALAVAAVVTAAALVLHGWGERARLRADTEADLSALVSLTEATGDREALLRGMARTGAGREGRLAVHLGTSTVGTSRLDPVPGRAAGRADVDVDGGTVLARPVAGPAGPAVVEAFVPAGGTLGTAVGWAAVLLALGTGAAVIGALGSARRVRPVVDDLTALTATARGLGDDDRPLRTRAMHTPETVALAAALDALADRFSEARAGERRLAADLSHRLRTPLTALALDAGAIGDGPAADRVRQTVTALNNDVDTLIRAPGRAPGPDRCDVAAVVRRRMGFWSALAQHSRRTCEFRTMDGAATVALTEDDVAAVIDALLGNIFRYTPAGTGFAVAVVRHAGWVTLVVDDAGPGVADPATALRRGVSSSGSTGLGLAIARDAVEATGGTVHIERAALGGARIRLRFGEVGAEHADPDEPRAWRLWGATFHPTDSPSSPHAPRPRRPRSGKPPS